MGHRRLSGEKAKYACLDSGQGCGRITENTLSGNWTASTEGSNFQDTISKIGI